MTMTAKRIVSCAIIKRLLALSFPLLLLAGMQAEESAFSAQSSINWKTEELKSTIVLDTVKGGIVMPTGRNAALQMLEMETPALLKDAYFSVLVDSSTRVGDSIERNEITLTDLNRILDAGKTVPPAFAQDMKSISISHTVSLSRLGSLYIRHRAAHEGRVPLETAPTRAYTGILVDARGSLAVHGEYSTARLEPCLFPKLWSAEMDLAYEKNMVAPSIALERGIVAYASSTDEAEYRPLIGNDPLRIIAREVFGKNRTDPVIPVKEYLKIISLEANRKLLAEGRVVILCDEDMLANRNQGPNRDDNYYFIRGEISAKLAKKPVRDVELTDSWEGLKMTLYDIRFEADTARVLAEERGRLDSIAEALKAAGPDARFVIAGHTASVGKPGGELELSIARARVITSELAGRGIPADHMVFSGYGGTRPVALNDSNEGRARNRRVEITITSASDMLR